MRKVPNGHQFESYGDLYIEDYPGVQYDPEKARQLVKESGYDGKEVITIEMNDGYYTNGNQAGEAIVGMLADVGIQAEVAYVDKFSFQADIRAWSSASRFDNPLGASDGCFLVRVQVLLMRKREIGYLRKNLLRLEIR